MITPAAVLMVDDTPANLTALEAVLDGLGLRLDRAASGGEALERMRASDYAVVITDVQMPEMDGLELAKRIRDGGRGRATPVIFLTAFDLEPALVRRAYASGAVDFVVKPFDPEILRAKVSVLVDLHRKTREVVLQAEQLRAAQAAAQAAAVTEARREWEAAATRARIERERDEAGARERELQRVDRLKDQFLATLAHELRNPLMSLLAAAELLDRRPVENPDLARLHGLVKRQVAHLSRLVEDSLEISRFSQGKISLRPRRLDLRETVERAVELTQAALDRRRIDLARSLPAAPVTATGDEVRLAQVIANLLDNAAKFSPEGGRVWLSLEAAAGQARIRVRDSGQGIPADQLRRVFEPFAQCRPDDTARGGLGIGLALVRQLVELHGGNVSATSGGGGEPGAELVVTLPLAVDPDRADREPRDPAVLESVRQAAIRAHGMERAPAAMAAATSGPASGAAPPAPVDRPPRARARARVLVVDDNPEIRSTVQVFLQLEGHSVLAADCGRAALEQIRSADPDVVLLDIGLPDLDGYAVAREVRAARSDRRPRLIAMTGNVGDGARDRALAAGFDAHLAKPIDGRILMRVVDG